MEINVQLTEAIVNQSLRLHYAHAPAKQKYSILFVPAAMLVLAIYFIVSDAKKGIFGSNAWMGIAYIGIAIAYFLYMRHRRVNTGRQLIKLLGTNSAFKMMINDEEVVTELPNGKLEHTWDTFHKALISNNLVLLYQPNLSFTMLDRSFFALGEFEQFKKMVTLHVPSVIQVS